MYSEPLTPQRNLPLGLNRARGALSSMRLAKARIKYRGHLRYGEGFRIGAGPIFATDGPVEFGDDVHVSRNLYVETELMVGSHVLISANVSMIGNDHPFDESATPITGFKRAPSARITIGNDCLIGFGATILGNVAIGDGCIIGARSLVIADVADNTIVGGVPAKTIRRRR